MAVIIVSISKFGPLWSTLYHLFEIWDPTMPIPGSYRSPMYCLFLDKYMAVMSQVFLKHACKLWIHRPWFSFHVWWCLNEKGLLWKWASLDDHDHFTKALNGRLGSTRISWRCTGYEINWNGVECIDNTKIETIQIKWPIIHNFEIRFVGY